MGWCAMSAEAVSILIVVRAGRSTIHHSWLYTAPTQMDVALSVYDDSDFSEQPVKHRHRATGGKFQGIKAFFDAYPDLLGAYDYYWLLEDDLYVPHETMLMVLKLLKQFRFMLATPALSYNSFSGWPINIRNDRLLFRGTDFVEIMAPIMSRSFLLTCLPLFGENYSGFGYEWLWRRFIEQAAGFAAILDGAPIVHTRPLGEGSLYQNRPADRPPARTELENFIAKFNLNRKVPFRDKFGVTCGAKPRVLVGLDLVQEMLSGYNALLHHDHTALLNCFNQLLKWPPIATLQDVRSLAGFNLIETYINNGGQ
jgi:hypothetical protein